MNVPRHWPAVVVLAVLAAGCGSSPGPVTRSPTATPPPATTTAPATATPSATAPSGHAPKVTVTPATGLKSGQQVLVQASGFSPGEALVITECANKGTATGPGDCDLTNMQSVTSDASGHLMTHLAVTKGPFGTNKIVCGPAQACLISVTQATLTPTQEADTPITFGLPAAGAILPAAGRAARERRAGCQHRLEPPGLMASAGGRKGPAGGNIGPCRRCGAATA
jgi:Neocarzinostatin family